MSNPTDTLDAKARWLGYAGLVPPVLAIFATVVDPAIRWLMIAAGFGYAAFIFSFLGGIWWGVAMRRQTAPLWVWLAAVAPSLIALALLLPWSFSWNWPEPAALILATLLLLSPLVDLAMGRREPLPHGWLSLRIQLSVGLALLTVLLSRI